MSKSTIIASFRYANAPAAIDFLCKAFGFARHAVYPDDKDPSIIQHAELTLGDSMIMLGTAMPGAAQERAGWKTPAEAGGVTNAIYCIVADVEAHHARAKDAGAEILRPPHDNEGYPGRGYETRDPEGYAWSFGTYDPWTMGV